MNTCGLGHDVVDVAAFAEQLSEPGSRMRSLFSVREVRQGAASVFQTDYANSAAGARYSAAYSSAPDNGPYAVMQEWRNARSAQRSAFGAGLIPHIHISLSHDGPIASAVVAISVE